MFQRRLSRCCWSCVVQTTAACSSPRHTSVERVSSSRRHSTAPLSLCSFRWVLPQLEEQGLHRILQCLLRCTSMYSSMGVCVRKCLCVSQLICQKACAKTSMINYKVSRSTPAPYRARTWCLLYTIACCMSTTLQ